MQQRKHLPPILSLLLQKKHVFIRNIFDNDQVGSSDNMKIFENFFNDIMNLMFGNAAVHHSHVTGKIIRYAHDFRNKNLKQLQNLIPVFAPNLFSFNFFFAVKGIRFCVWQTKQLNIGGSNLTNAQYANIGLQGKFIDTIKYYQKSLASLVAIANEEEKVNISNCCQKFLLQNEHCSSVFKSLTDEEKIFLLDYFSERKGVIPYERLKSYEDLDAESEGGFFAKTEFFSSLKNKIILDADYENVKKFWQILRLKKLSELNNIYNFQDTIILCEIFENGAKEMMKRFPYKLRKCTSASSQSSCIHRYLSKVINVFQHRPSLLMYSRRSLSVDLAV